MFIIVTVKDKSERINMNLVRKYTDYTIKFANDHIINVKEKAEDIDLIVLIAQQVGYPIDLKIAKTIYNQAKEKVDT